MVFVIDILKTAPLIRGARPYDGRRAQSHHPRFDRLDRHAGARRHRGEPRPVRGRRARRRARTRDGSPRRPSGSASRDTALGADDAEQLVRAVEADVVLNGITGSVGLGPTLAALETGAHARAREQGVADRRRRAGQARARRPARSSPSTPSTRRSRRRCGRASRARCAGSCSPHPVARSAGAPRASLARRHAARGARASDLGHGPRRHDQLVDARQQGPRGHRGAPALRRAVRPHRRDRASAVDRALDGRVRRRLDDRAGVAARHAAADLARPRLAATACRASACRSTGRSAHSWTFEPLDDEAFPAVALAKRVGAAGGDLPGRLQRGERAGGRRVPRRARSATSTSSTPCERVVDAHEPAGELTPRVAAPRPSAGRGRRPTRIIAGRADTPPHSVHRRLAAFQAARELAWTPWNPCCSSSSASSSSCRPRRSRSALHEIGHLVPAKLFGVKVTQYMIGFGQTLFSFAARRDRVRRQGDPARRLHLDDRDVPARQATGGSGRNATTGFIQTMVQDARDGQRRDASRRATRTAPSTGCRSGSASSSCSAARS